MLAMRLTSCICFCCREIQVPSVFFDINSLRVSLHVARRFHLLNNVFRKCRLKLWAKVKERLGYWCGILDMKNILRIPWMYNNLHKAILSFGRRAEQFSAMPYCSYILKVFVQCRDILVCQIMFQCRADHCRNQHWQCWSSFTCFI